MKANLIPIGNSHGIRLPKAVIEQAGLTSELELEVSVGQVIIRPVGEPRKKWEIEAEACHAANEDVLQDWDAAVADFEGDW